jgi:hypothetical protein
MKEKDKNIFRDLKDHEQQPPAYLLDKILEGMAEPPADPEHHPWKALQDHAIPPPALLYEQIQQKKTKKGVVVYLRRIATIAAVLLIGFFIFRIVSPTATGKRIGGQPLLTINKDRSDFPTDTITPANLSINKKPLLKTSSTQSTRPADADEVRAFLANGGVSTFMDCADCQFSVYYSGKKKKIVIDVDQYSSTIVSDKMLQFMKDLYKTNRRKKPTAKARRTKKILNRWKENDATYFDSSGHKNALDPIDLTEYFIDQHK